MYFYVVQKLKGKTLNFLLYFDILNLEHWDSSNGAGTNPKKFVPQKSNDPIYFHHDYQQPLYVISVEINVAFLHLEKLIQFIDIFFKKKKTIKKQTLLHHVNCLRCIHTCSKYNINQVKWCIKKLYFFIIQVKHEAEVQFSIHKL